jgi:hypothetical protein
VDVGLPTTLEALSELRDSMIAITAGSSPVHVWLIPGSHDDFVELAEAHIK